jgi:hypothetical protein
LRSHVSGIFRIVRVILDFRDDRVLERRADLVCGEFSSLVVVEERDDLDCGHALDLLRRQRGGQRADDVVVDLPDAGQVEHALDHHDRPVEVDPVLTEPDLGVVHVLVRVHPVGRLVGRRLDRAAVEAAQASPEVAHREADPVLVGVEPQVQGLDHRVRERPARAAQQVRVQVAVAVGRVEVVDPPLREDVVDPVGIQQRLDVIADVAERQRGVLLGLQHHRHGALEVEAVVGAPDVGAQRLHQLALLAVELATEAMREALAGFDPEAEAGVLIGAVLMGKRSQWTGRNDPALAVHRGGLEVEARHEFREFELLHCSFSAVSPKKTSSVSVVNFFISSSSSHSTP